MKAIVLLLLLLAFAIGCGAGIPDVPTLTKVDSKTEPAGQLHNHMVLYAVNGKFNPADFTTICKATKSNPTVRGFNFVVVFDSVSNAAFPANPFTAMYGGEEKTKMTHIIAVYEYNSVNGFSEATVYNPNMYTGKGTITKP